MLHSTTPSLAIANGSPGTAPWSGGATGSAWSRRAARFLPAVAVLLIGCAWVAAAATRGATEETFELKRQSGTRVYEYTVTAGTAAIEVELEANVPEGRITGRVVDPQGTEHLVLRLEGGRGHGSTGQVAATPGVWRLELGAEGATGRGLVRFASR